MIYEDRIVAFIDILGFSQLIKTTIDVNETEDEETTEKIKDFINQIQKDFDNDSSFDSKIATQCSDSLIISYKKDEESAVYKLLTNVAYLIAEGIQRGFLLRGGICYGKVCHNNEMIFGPAYNNAYNLEEKIAKYPRIILSPEIINIGGEFHGWQNSLEEEVRFIKHWLKKDSDGFYFIDYFSCFNPLLSGWDFYDYWLYLQKIKEIIIENQNSTSLDVLQKMNWMITFYNSALKKFQNDISDNTEFQIIKNELLLNQKFN